MDSSLVLLSRFGPTNVELIFPFARKQRLGLACLMKENTLPNLFLSAIETIQMPEKGFSLAKSLTKH